MVARDRVLRFVVGAGAMVGGLTALRVMAYQGDGRLHGGLARGAYTIYGPAHTLLALVLACSGLVLAFAWNRPLATATLGVIGLCSSQLAGFGFVAYRRWPLYRGCCTSVTISHEQRLRHLALGMGLVCAVVAAAALVFLIAHGSLGWRGWSTAVGLTAAMVLLATIPKFMADPGTTHDTVAAALTYAIPFAVALGTASLMDRGAAFAVAGAVALSALIATWGTPFLDLRLPFHHAEVFAVGAAVVVAVGRLVESARSRTPAT